MFSGSSYLYKVHHPESQVAHRENSSKQDSREVLPVDGKKDERQAGREGQQEDDEAEACDGQHLEHGADGVHHWRGRIRAQDVV